MTKAELGHEHPVVNFVLDDPLIAPKAMKIGFETPWISRSKLEAFVDSLRSRFLDQGVTRRLTKCLSQSSCGFNSSVSQLQNSPAPQISNENQAEEIKELMNPLRFPDYFGIRKLVKVKELFEARVHYGHKLGTLEPLMKPYIFGSRLEHIIFDLDQTAQLLQEALNFTAHIAYRGGIILFVCHSPQHTLTVEKTAVEAGEYAHAREWNHSILTNSEKMFHGMTRLPDLCILLSTLNPLMQEHKAVSDAAKMCIPTIGIVDSNSNPQLISYPVPGNDDSPSAIQLYCELFRDAILVGKAKRKEDLKL
uniref:Small ribosomal subunit protein uS2m n=1 Tax=Eubosmina coregoni TaxID=186181 RepID=A0A4Y7LNX6_9CRUS|nr:EOG090X0B5N [Eubosmina coregoni]SVE69986.1 EOG090X0B5N [Eubosmina coregoni]